MSGFAQKAFEFTDAQADFEGALFEAEVRFEFVTWDAYDGSLELKKAPDDLRLNPDQQRIIFDAGFSKVYVNHNDGWETHYSWAPGDFSQARGWRRRWVPDETVTTSRGIGHHEPGYFEISYWPEGWMAPNVLKWRDTGYMRIVPDPLEVTAPPSAPTPHTATAPRTPGNAHDA